VTIVSLELYETAIPYLHIENDKEFNAQQCLVFMGVKSVYILLIFQDILKPPLIQGS
jgi:hypothetical protein